MNQLTLNLSGITNRKWHRKILPFEKLAINWLDNKEDLKQRVESNHLVLFVYKNKLYTILHLYKASNTAPSTCNTGARSSWNKTYEGYYNTPVETLPNVVSYTIFTTLTSHVYIQTEIYVILTRIKSYNDKLKLLKHPVTVNVGFVWSNECTADIYIPY